MHDVVQRQTSFGPALPQQRHERPSPHESPPLPPDDGVHGAPAAASPPFGLASLPDEPSVVVDPPSPPLDEAPSAEPALASSAPAGPSTSLPVEPPQWMQRIAVVANTATALPIDPITGS